ncbi:MAG: methyltransferase domain-containing protein [Candidatus Azambacteria bacterium]|nr:methyltransferase domain-containing protein [Candidatus Azambacteria bacterium]
MIFQPDRYLLKQQIKKYAHYIKGIVLDAGSGEIRRYKSFLKFEKYLTLDINSKNNPDIIGSVLDIPLNENSVDSIVSTQVLEHVKNPQKAISEFYRVIKKGRFCLLTAPQWSELHEEPNDYQRFTKFGLEELFKNAGFKIILIERRGGFWAANCQMKIRYAIDLFNLNRHVWLAKIFNLFFLICGRLSILIDGLDKSRANQKHTLGWLIITQK